MLRVLDTRLPLHSGEAEKRLETLIQTLSPDAEIMVETGDETSQIVGLAKQAKCDLLFLGEGHALKKGLGGNPSLRRLLSKLPCPAICMDGASRQGIRWSIEPRHVEQYVDMRLTLRGLAGMRTVR